MSAPHGMYLHRTATVNEPVIPRRYDPDFRPSAEYLASMPDMMDAVDAIQGARVPIQQVGVSGFKLPLRFATVDGEPMTLEATVTGTVSLEAELKGINMSRIVRTFYDHRDRVFEPDTLAAILAEYRDRIGAFLARLRVAFSYPMLQTSLRSGLEGYQYYRVVYEASMSTAGRVRRFVHFDFAYSSACPCSAELSEHARDTRGVYAIPHSQRSRARLRVELADGATVRVEDLQRHCLRALQTETQVMVKREDEQAFAEMNGAQVKFVEDAARLVYEQLDADPRIHDFEVICSHMESLHSHDAVSAICKGVPGGFEADYMDFDALTY